MTATIRVGTAEARIVRAFGRMPYFPMTRLGADYFATPGPTRGEFSIDLHRLADVLEGFADVLVTVGEGNTREHDELSELRHDVAAMQRLFGITKR